MNQEYLKLADVIITSIRELESKQRNSLNLEYKKNLQERIDKLYRAAEIIQHLAII